MGVWLGIGKIIASKLLGKRHSLLGDAVMRKRVGPLDLDPNMHMTNTRYYSLFDLGRVEHLVCTNLLPAMTKRKCGPAIGGTALRWRKSLKLFQKYEVVSRLACWDEKWLYYDQTAVSGGEIYALAFSRIAVVGKGGTVPPQTIIEEAGFKDTSPPTHESVEALEVATHSLKVPVAA